MFRNVIMNKKSKLLNIIITIIPFLCIILLWAIIACSIDNDKVLPTVSQTVKQFFNLFGFREFYSIYFTTLLRALISFCVSFVVAMGFAILAIKNSVVQKIISPIISVMRSLPTIAVVLLLIVWTNSQIAPVIVTVIVILPTVYINVKSALESVSKEQLQMCKAFNVSKKNVFKKVVMPQIAGEITYAIGGGLALNLKLMVAAEVIADTSKSIGKYLSLSKLYDQTVMMMALVMVTVVSGLIIELVFSLISKRMNKWK